MGEVALERLLSPPNAAGTYGTLGTLVLANVPGARSKAIAWTDSAGRLWLFGGAGYDGVAGLGYLNDVWVIQSN